MQRDPAETSVVTRLKNLALDLGPGGSHHFLHSLEAKQYFSN